MSEQRIPDMAFSRTIGVSQARLPAKENGKIKHGSRKSTRFELYRAGQF